MRSFDRPRCQGTYSNGQPYKPARGRRAPRNAVEDHWNPDWAVIALDTERPTRDEFLRKIRREWKIRFYETGTQRDYQRELRTFVDWLGNPPHEATREDVRDFLAFLADSGSSSSTVSHYLTAIRNAFDKMCGATITLGLRTPRKPSRLPTILSHDEMRLLLQAAVRQRDKLLLGLLYATGTRNLEACRLRWCDIDFDRRIVTVRQGKGRKDRQVMLPTSYVPLLRERRAGASPDGFLFPGDRPGRYISPRTVQRIMKRTLRLAGIDKPATPHSLRHSFAAHLFEDGVDIRHISQLLGHVKLETTMIYVKVARVRPTRLVSPLDRLGAPSSEAPSNAPSQAGRPPVGRISVHMRAAVKPTGPERQAQVTLGVAHPEGPVYLTGTMVTEMRPGWLNVQVPPLEKWDEPMSKLTEIQRDRLSSPDFFETLQREIVRRFTPELFASQKESLSLRGEVRRGALRPAGRG